MGPHFGSCWRSLKGAYLSATLQWDLIRDSDLYVTGHTSLVWLNSQCLSTNQFHRLKFTNRYINTLTWLSNTYFGYFKVPTLVCAQWIEAISSASKVKLGSVTILSKAIAVNLVTRPSLTLRSGEFAAAEAMLIFCLLG